MDRWRRDKERSIQSQYFQVIPSKLPSGPSRQTVHCSLPSSVGRSGSNGHGKRGRGQGRQRKWRRRRRWWSIPASLTIIFRFPWRRKTLQGGVGHYISLWLSVSELCSFDFEWSPCCEQARAICKSSAMIYETFLSMIKGVESNLTSIDIEQAWWLWRTDVSTDCLEMRLYEMENSIRFPPLDIITFKQFLSTWGMADSNIVWQTAEVSWWWWWWYGVMSNFQPKELTPPRIENW